MPRKPRSLKEEMDRLTTELRDRGATWTEIAREFQRRYRLNSRQAFREAHRYTQERVVDEWRALWPSEPFSVRKLGSWEAWPAITGNEPPVAGLNRLARIYGCRARDLVDGEDHTASDQNVMAARARDAVPSPRPATLAFSEIQAVLPSQPLPGPMSPAQQREREYDRLVQAFTDWATQMNRRDALALIGAAATSAYASPLADRADESQRPAMAGADPSRVDDATLGHVQAVLRHAMRQEDALGPQAALATVLAQRQLVAGLLSAGVPGHMRAKTLSLLADIHRCTAWMLFNLNDFRGADHHYAQAREAAHQADDDAMCSMVLANWSQLATWRGDPRLGVEHALGALAWGQRAGSRLLTAYACDVGARAYAAVVRRSARGERRQDQARCFRSVEQAERELHGAAADDPGARLVPFYGEGQYLSTKAGCLLDTGDPARALDVATTAAAGIDPAFVRNAAYIRLKTAQAHLELRDIEQACEHLGEAARLAARNTSPRLVRSVMETREKLGPWHRTRSVAALDERLHVTRLIA
ncbi:hypothetical protein Sme01_17830 [Sphaerisporangium melleum]|uniref:Uncharacterized protein n=1 Tax=Sphaerisporangium melleum TaxID=321316 RepID=A0A917VIP8_9ACTN|nr:hypothetical protein [Sphaerisporangium melleum]GGK83731.1 hypothetical protein GCM10007964_27770 [Sphaerisporangium melleum]GII69307.1 hypothetical protein Sme01_17830 [Sphaerisporangium melleum]